MTKGLQWYISDIGPAEVVARDTRFHGRSSVIRLRTQSGCRYLKIHRDREPWEREVHAYERWGAAFDALAPRLLAVHEGDPLALVIDEMPGQVMDRQRLSAAQEEKAWHSAGQVLAGLHAFATGEFFGPCKRDGSCAGVFISDPVEYISTELDSQIDKATRMGQLNDNLLSVVRAARGMVSDFTGERPVPCHRDYSPANWLVTADGAWVGVIDFEMAHWDIRVADFSRYPHWEWIHRPHLLEALCAGYGRQFTQAEEQQLLVMHVLYSLAAITWGREHSFFGFAKEGQEAIEHLGKRLT